MLATRPAGLDGDQSTMTTLLPAKQKPKSSERGFFCLGICVTMGIPVLFLAIVLLDGTTAQTNLDALFLGRCSEFQKVIRPDLFVDATKDCVELLRLFNEAYLNAEPCNVSVDSYDPFALAAKHDIVTLNRTLYWSGPVVPLVYDYSANGRRYTTIRDILAGYIIQNLDIWCGDVDDSTGASGGFCPFDECGMQALGAVWGSLSRSFAQQVQGGIRVMLNGSIGTAYYADGTFAKYELPYLDAERNPVLHVLLVHNIDTPDAIRETCENGTLLNLKRDVEEKNMIFSCTDDPLDVLYLQCVDHLDDSKCQNL